MKPAFLLLAAFFASAAVAAPGRVVLPANAVPLSYDVSIVPNPAAKTFAGTVAISVAVKTPSADIVLNAADLSFRKVSLSGRKDAPQLRFDAKAETATLHFASPVMPGTYTLTIAYDGKIGDSAAGLFALDYDSPNGSKRALFTQFENSDARRFLPCWDEPGIRAPFTLTATLPQDEMAVSNMPVATEEKLLAGLKRVRFAPSPEMSSYLLFYAQGDFERVAKKVGNVEIGIVVKRGDTAKARYALDTAETLLPYYNSYFGTPYPLPKLDFIAGPGASEFTGAMENWGAIFFFEGALEVDPVAGSERQRRNVWFTVAHEMAHQWFGDLVTMAWWDDLWLNEGFASWMEFKAADRVYPQWNVWLGALREREGALASDARAGTHPVVQQITDVLQASEAFDEITYIKGAAVVRMLEDYLGEEKFAAGVRAYMKKYAYANTVTDDLWTELEKASGQPVKQIARDFTLQPGVPLIRAVSVPQGVALHGDRYAVDESGRTKLVWHVPVTVRSADGKPVWRGLVGSEPVTIAASGPVVVNAGQAGYFRTAYDRALFAGLADRFADLAPIDQLGLMSDSAAMATIGAASPGDVLQFAAKVTPSSDVQVQEAAAVQMERLIGRLKGAPGEARARSFARTVLQPLADALGWNVRPGEAANVMLLRAHLLATLGGAVGDPATLAEARRRFALFLDDRASVPAELRSTVLGIVAGHASLDDWNRLHDLARTTESSTEKRDFYRLLGHAGDPALAQKALDLSLTPEVPATLRTSIVSEVAQIHPDLAFDFAVAHHGAFDELLEPSSRSIFYLRLPSASHDTAMLAKLDAYAAAQVPESARGGLLKVKAGIAAAIKLRAEAVPALDAYLKTKCRDRNGGVVCKP